MKSEVDTKETTGTVHGQRLWQLYKLAFSSLIDRYPCLPAHLYEQFGDREVESAQDIAHHAMTLAICAAHKFENYEKRIEQFNSEIERQ